MRKPIAALLALLVGGLAAWFGTTQLVNGAPELAGGLIFVVVALSGGLALLVWRFLDPKD